MNLLKKYMELGILIEPGLEEHLKDTALFEKIKTLREKPIVLTKEFLETLQKAEIKIFTKEQKKEYNIKDVVNFYTEKYETLRSCLMRLVELKNIVSIANASGESSIIGMVKEKGEKHIEIEDMTSCIKAILPEEKMKLVAEDDVVAIHGSMRNKLFFASNIYWPDVPLREIKTIKAKIAFLFGQESIQIQNHSTFNISINSLPVYVEINDSKNSMIILLTKNIDALAAVKKRYFKTLPAAFPPEFIIEPVPDIILNYCCPQQKATQQATTQNYKGITIISASGNVLIDLESREVRAVFL